MQIWLYQFSEAQCQYRGGSSLGAGWVNRCEGVSTKAHLFSVFWTKQLRARWIEGPWGAPNSSVAWLLNSLTMLCLKASGKWSFHLPASEHMINGAAAADPTLETLVAFYFTIIWGAKDNYVLWLLICVTFCIITVIMSAISYAFAQNHPTIYKKQTNRKHLNVNN